MNPLRGCILLFNIVSLIACGQSREIALIDKAKLDSLFAELNEDNLGMGSIAISRDGQLLYQKAFGYAQLNQSEKVPATTKTAYRIGSVTKMFTAVLVFQLIEEG